MINHENIFIHFYLVFPHKIFSEYEIKNTVDYNVNVVFS